MRQQAIEFGTTFEAETVLAIDATSRPFKVKTNTSIIETHAIIVATGAESNWLNVPGEYEMRGGGVCSCATCYGHMYRGKHVLKVGGGDTAKEDALVLARTSEVSVWECIRSFNLKVMLQLISCRLENICLSLSSIDEIHFVHQRCLLNVSSSIRQLLCDGTPSWWRF